MNIEALFNQQFRRVYLFYYRKTMHQHVAEDLTSKAFLVFAQKARDLEIDEPEAFLHGIVKKLWLQYLRDKYRSKEIVADLSAEIPDERPTSSEPIDFAKTLIASYVQQLPPKQQKIIELRYVNELTITEIAEHLGKDKNYVKTTHGRALRSLRKLLAETSS